MKIVYVEWLDSYAPLSSGWFSLDVIEENSNGKVICHSVGFQFVLDDEWLTLLQTIQEDEAYHPFRIPVKSIIKLVELPLE